MSPSEIDPSRNYSAKEVARMFGVSRRTVYDTLTPNPSPFTKKLYSGKAILAAMAAKGHGVKAISQEKVLAGIRELERMR